jgi:peptidyl-prolyl cis-trans isomerase C
MKLHHLSLALGLTALLAGCDQLPLTPNQHNSAAPATVTDNSPVVATVNGTQITERTLTIYQQQRHNRRPSDPTSQDRDAVLDEIINLELARQAGVKEGIDQQPDVLLQIEQQRRAVIAAAAIQHQLQANPVSDAELKKLYDDNVGDGKEYKARHILVEDQDKAREVIAELDKGADFSELAKQHSTGPSGKNGGELGWFSASQMVKPFSDALAGIEKGSYTKEPVQTQFGWHVIILDDERESTVPSFEQVKGQLQMMAQNQRVQEYVANLRSTATINIVPAAAPAPAAPAPASAPAAPAQDSAPAESTGDTPSGSTEGQ